MRTLSRNDFFRLVVGGLGGGLLLSACGDDGDDDDEDGDATNAGGNSEDANTGGDNGNNGAQAGNDASANPSQDAGLMGNPDAGTTPSLDSGMQGPKDAGMVDSGASKMCTTGAKIGTIDLHPHTLTISAADVTAGVQKTYTIGGDHTHQITLTASHMAMIKAGMDVTVTSTTDKHKHLVQIICA